MPDSRIADVKRVLASSTNIVFLGGAGVSTASGIPDFRSQDGIYKQPAQHKYPPETILSIPFFRQHPREFYEYYLSNFIFKNVKPNPAHFALADLERAGRLKAVITQNIDGLHQASGSKNVLELHGNAARFYCLGCGKPYDLQFVQAASSLPPLCPRCGNLIRPDVVLYGEALDQDLLQAAIEAIRTAELLLVGGTSLSVYPAAGLINFYSGDQFILINREATAFDRRANYVFHDDIASLLPQLVSSDTC